MSPLVRPYRTPLALDTPIAIHGALRMAAAGVGFERWGCTRARGASARSAAGRVCPPLSPLAARWDLLGAVCVVTATPTPWELPTCVPEALAQALDFDADRARQLHLVTRRLDELEDRELWTVAAMAAHRIWSPQAVAA